MDDRFKVTIQPTTDGELATWPEDVLYQRMAEAGWDLEDPGKGKAVLDEFGREILNPIPVAPPIGYNPEVSVMDRLHQMLAARLEQLQGGDTLDESEEEANDFDIPDVEDMRSIYEIEMVSEVPRIPVNGPPVIEAPAPVSSPPDGGSIPNGDGGSTV